jgi:hypothetical protein
MVIFQPLFVYFWDLSWLRQLVDNLSPWKQGFNPTSIHGEFVMNEVALGEVSLQVLRSFLCQYHPPVLHIYQSTDTT